LVISAHTHIHKTQENVGGTSLLEALVKVGGVFVFGALSLTLYAWVRIREREDPVLYDDQGAQGVLVLDNIVTVLFALLMVWIVALSIVAVGVIHSHASFVLRFRFLMVPSAILTLSMLIAMFFRVYGPFNRNGNHCELSSSPSFCISSPISPLLSILPRTPHNTKPRTAMSFMYFYTLYNVYVWVLSFGFWPIRAGYSTASESSPLAV
jgi:hypothetical protein